MNEMIYVLVTTKYRGIFFGAIKESDEKEVTITLHEARNCIYWSSDIGGFLGLTSKGPSDKCTIGAPAGGPITLHKITSVVRCNEKAIEAWKNI